MRWCVVIRALKTTTQLALPTLSISVSTIWGTFTLVWSWEAWIRSGGESRSFKRGIGARANRDGVLRASLHSSRRSSERASSPNLERLGIHLFAPACRSRHLPSRTHADGVSALRQRLPVGAHSGSNYFLQLVINISRGRDRRQEDNQSFKPCSGRTTTTTTTTRTAN